MTQDGLARQEPVAMVKVDSGYLDRVGFRPEIRRPDGSVAVASMLYVQFCSGPEIFGYSGVPLMLWVQLMDKATVSKGKFFIARIRDVKGLDGRPRYPWTKWSDLEAAGL